MFFRLYKIFTYLCNMKVHVFNPENDMALADGKPGYTAPALIRQMREEMHWLPRWWADDDDIVWNGEDKLQLKEGDEILPWGWSPALIHQLRQAGVSDEFLPNDDEMGYLRQLSHRKTAVEALRLMHEQGFLGEALKGNSICCCNWEEIQEALKQHPNAILKSPWSSSGRGIMDSQTSNLEGWCRNILRLQGSVIVEERLTKLTDFALEFWCDGKGGVEYKGLSLFYTNEAGAYLGNWVAPEGQKFQWLMQYADPQLLMQIRDWWQNYLPQFKYRGPVGIDMMLCPDGICPCIEINWRMTMGYVANILTLQGKFGRLVVEYVYGHYSAEVEAFC